MFVEVYSNDNKFHGRSEKLVASIIIRKTVQVIHWRVESYKPKHPEPQCEMALYNGKKIRRRTLIYNLKTSTSF